MADGIELKSQIVRIPTTAHATGGALVRETIHRRMVIGFHEPIALLGL